MENGHGSSGIMQLLFYFCLVRCVQSTAIQRCWVICLLCLGQGYSTDWWLPSLSPTQPLHKWFVIHTTLPLKLFQSGPSKTHDWQWHTNPDITNSWS